MSTTNIWLKIQQWCGWFAILLLAVSAISGFGWDIRTSNLVYEVTGGLLNRTLSADIHTAIIVPMALVLLCHIASRLQRFFVRRKEPRLDGC